jgi:hypothetical protein
MGILEIDTKFVNDHEARFGLLKFDDTPQSLSLQQSGAFARQGAMSPRSFPEIVWFQRCPDHSDSCPDGFQSVAQFLDSVFFLIHALIDFDSEKYQLLPTMATNRDALHLTQDGSPKQWFCVFAIQGSAARF